MADEPKQVGDTWSPQVTITDDGAPADPPTLTLKIRDPTGLVSTTVYPAAPIVRDDVGEFHADIMLTSAGTWVVQWETTAPAQVQGMSITVTPAPIDQVPNPLTLDGLKRRMDRELDVDDDKLQEYLDAAFVQAQMPSPHGCGRLLTPDPPDPEATTTRTVTVLRGRARVQDASALTSVTVDDTVVTNYKPLRKDGYIIQISGLAEDATQAVLTGRFGFTALPGNLADAIYVLAARMSYEEAAMYADNVAILEGDAATVYYRQLPVRTKMVFAGYATPLAVAGLR